MIRPGRHPRELVESNGPRLWEFVNAPLHRNDAYHRATGRIPRGISPWGVCHRRDSPQHLETTEHPAGSNRKAVVLSSLIDVERDEAQLEAAQEPIG